MSIIEWKPGMLAEVGDYPNQVRGLVQETSEDGKQIYVRLPNNCLDTKFIIVRSEECREAPEPEIKDGDIVRLTGEGNHLVIGTAREMTTDQGMIWVEVRPGPGAMTQRIKVPISFCELLIEGGEE